MFVVVDTNVFVYETHMLRKKGGPDLVRLLRAMNGRLLIPEILHLEFVEKSVEYTNEKRRAADSAVSTMTTLLGQRYDISFPGDETVKLGAVARLRELDALTICDPLTAELKVAAADRTIAKRRPFSKTDHGYKDCLIWESILRLPSGSEVKLISKDNKAFFDGDAFAPELIAEALERGIKVAGYKDVERVVGELSAANPALDLVALETKDFVEQTPEPLDEVVPPAPAPPPAGAGKLDQVPAGDIDAVRRRLADARQRFDTFDLKVLAYIAYFGSASKEDLFRALADADVAADVAKNVAERLVMNGFVRDIGNHYLVVDRATGELVAPTVEAEIIAWLQKNRRRNGN